MENLYPTPKEIRTVRQYKPIFSQEEDNNKTKANVMPFIIFLRSIWWCPEWGFITKISKNSFGKKCLKLELHTGGWSGNEEIICALQKSQFWFFWWESSRRGGHYYFEIPLKIGRLNLCLIKL